MSKLDMRLWVEAKTDLLLFLEAIEDGKTVHAWRARGIPVGTISLAIKRILISNAVPAKDLDQSIARFLVWAQMCMDEIPPKSLPVPIDSN